MASRFHKPNGNFNWSGILFLISWRTSAAFLPFFYPPEHLVYFSLMFRLPPHFYFAYILFIERMWNPNIDAVYFGFHFSILKRL
jgi:hypothetical protein